MNSCRFGASAIADGSDVYTLIEPTGGYPGGNLSGVCQALEGTPAFQGSSGGWVTDTFDLLEFKGKTLYLAFVPTRSYVERIRRRAAALAS